MKNPSLMSKMNSATNFRQQRSGGLIGKAGLWVGYSGGERAALDEPHGKKVIAAEVTYFIDGHNVGMIELSRRFRLGLETLDLRLAGELPSKNHFERHDAIQVSLPGAINDTHSSMPNLTEQLVIAELSWSVGGFRVFCLSSSTEGVIWLISEFEEASLE
jgi:hypothetical protein